MQREPARRSRMLGVSVGAAGTSGALKAMEAAAKTADIVELRLDFMADCDLRALLRDPPLRVIVTNRPVREGGRYKGSEADRVRPLQAAIELGAAYVDIEEDAAGLIPDRGSTGLIVSHHDFERMPLNAKAIHRGLQKLGADVVKVVGLARRPEDSLAALEVFDPPAVMTISIAMGEHGRAGRVLALRHSNCFLTYGTLGTGETVAPGQLPLEVMLNVYRVREIGPGTRAYGVVSEGDVSLETMAKLNALIRESGIDGVAVPLRIGTSEVARLQALADRLYSGFWTPEGCFDAAPIAGDTYAGGGTVQALVSLDGRLWGVGAPYPEDAVAAWAKGGS